MMSLNFSSVSWTLNPYVTNRMNSLNLYFKTIWILSPYQRHGLNLMMTWYPVNAPLLATLSIIYPDQKKTGGGVALLFRSSLFVSMKNYNIDYLTFESLHAEVTCNSRSLRLVNIYRPERDVDGKHVNFSSFLQEFERLIVNYLLHPSDIILTGDFNIHMDSTSNNYANQFKDLLSAYGLIQHITSPTHRYGHCLDLIIIRENTSPLISNITIHPGLSDHYAIITDMNL